MGWLRVLTKDFILFCKLVQPSPSSLQLPSLRHRHRYCRPRHCPHPCPPPSLPLPLPSLLPLPLPLLTCQPCHCLHRLATLTLFIARHPHRRHSRHRRHRPCCHSPRTLAAVAITLATIAIAIVIARHPRCVAIALFVASAFTPPPPLSPSHRLRWGRGGPYQSGA
jgi:hypothetical protein